MRTRKNHAVLSARLSKREAALLPLNARMVNIFFDFSIVLCRANKNRYPFYRIAVFDYSVLFVENGVVYDSSKLVVAGVVQMYSVASVQVFLCFAVLR